MAPTAALLLPQPRTLRALDGEVRLRSPCGIVASSGGAAAVEWLHRSLTDLGLVPGTGGAGSAHPQVRLALAPHEPLGQQGYRLLIERDGVDVVAADPAGLFYGAVTLCQWLRLMGRRDGGELRAPRVEIVDSPDFLARGFLLDVSRNRVPRLDTLFELVELLASLKFNQLQLYTEHTFAYRGHESVWRDSSPLTDQDVRELDQFCRERFVELVPNQNSLGHLHRWLVHEPYRALAERPDGVQHAFGRAKEPFSLCPTDPGSLELLEDLFEQLLPHFSSRQFNVGLDETFDLGTGRSAQACAERGKQVVYLDFLERVHRLVASWGHRMQFWGDIVLEHPDLITRLPRDVIALDWGYEADHPFESETRAFADAGLDFYVCPGTSSWNSLGGRVDNAVANLRGAALAGHANGASGYLVTDWGDFGHLQPQPISYPGIIAGAAFAWNTSLAAADDLPLRGLLEKHVAELREPARVAALLTVGAAHARTGARLRNGSVLFRLLVHADETVEHERYERLSIDGLRDTLELLDTVDLPRGNGGRALVDRELEWVAKTLSFACRLGITRLEAGRKVLLADLPGTARRHLGNALEPLIDELPELWLARSRPGGLDDSLRYLTAVRGLLAD